MGKALIFGIILLALFGIWWAFTCAVVWAICWLMHWTFTWAIGTAIWLVCVVIALMKG